MPILTKEQLKTYFQNGDTPAEEDFSNLIDSLAHTTEATKVTEITWLELRTLISNNALISGMFYKLLFQTKHLIPNTTQIHTGYEETILILALSNDIISQRTFSLTHPQDVIFLDINNTLCEDGQTPREGKITYRKDSKRNLETWYDFRNVKFRRWKIDAISNSALNWQPLYNYSIGNCIYYQGIFYRCLKHHTSKENFDELFWQTIFIEEDINLSYNTTLNTVGAVLNANLNIFQDYHTFDNSEAKNISIGKMTDDSYNNIVIFGEGEASAIDIGYNSSNMTIFSFSMGNIIGNDCNGIILINSSSNQIGNNCSDLIISASNFNFLQNNLFRFFFQSAYNNSIKNNIGNTSLSYLSGCILEADSGNNKIVGAIYTQIGHFATYNIIGPGSSNTKIGNYCSNNLFAEEASNNSIGDYSSFNIFNANSSFNCLGKNCSRNVIGESGTGKTGHMIQLNTGCSNNIIAGKKIHFDVGCEFNFISPDSENIYFGPGIKNKKFIRPQRNLRIAIGNTTPKVLAGHYSQIVIDKESSDGHLWFDEVTPDGLVTCKKLGDYEVIEELNQPQSLTATANQTSILLNWVDSNETYRRNIKVVVLGSSTAFGSGASNPSSRWVDHFEAVTENISEEVEVINLAQPGITSYHLMPDDFTPSVPNRPAADTTRNITYAIDLHPDIIIINLSSDDIALEYDLEAEVKNNYYIIKQSAESAGIKIIITTSQPRTDLSYHLRKEIQGLAEWIVATFESHAVNIYHHLTQFSPTNEVDDLTIKNEFRYQGDSYNINDQGHLIISNLVSQSINNLINESAKVQNYLIERSTNSNSNFAQHDIIDPLSQSYEDINISINVEYFYRVKAIAIDFLNDSQYSNVESAIVGQLTLIQTININTGSTSNAAGWTSVPENNSYNLLNSQGQNSGCQMTSSAFSSTGGGTGGAFPDSGTSYNIPNDIMQSYLYVTNIQRNLTFTGRSGKVYDIVIFGSRLADSSRMTQYTINGIAKTLECWNNTNETVEFKSVTLNSNNQIIISVSNAPGYTFGYINALIIKEYE